jgi:hypothetical protein
LSLEIGPPHVILIVGMIVIEAIVGLNAVIVVVIGATASTVVVLTEVTDLTVVTEIILLAVISLGVALRRRSSSSWGAFSIT